MYGIDFTHKNVAFAEAGRGCCEFWLAIAITKVEQQQTIRQHKASEGQKIQQI